MHEKLADILVDRLERPGDGEVVFQLYGDPLVREGLDAAVAEGHADEEEGELDDELEDVSQGKVGEVRIVLLEMVAEEDVDGADGRDEVGVGDDHALRGAGRA